MTRLRPRLTTPAWVAAIEWSMLATLAILSVPLNLMMLAGDWIGGLVFLLNGGFDTKESHN